MNPLRILQLNVERHRHTEERILPFLKKHPFDVICLQELCDHDAAHIQESLGLELYFEPRSFRDCGIEGVGILSRHNIHARRAIEFAGTPLLGTTPDRENNQELHRFVVVIIDIVVDGALYTIGTLHFPWTPDGNADAFQSDAMDSLLAHLKQEERLILTGDFNAPRGRPMWERLAARYRDNIPEVYTSSLDLILHRVGHLELMVDGIFSTPHYSVANVERVCGISDHCGFIANISLSA